jgi:hypothetical protein
LLQETTDYNKTNLDPVTTENNDLLLSYLLEIENARQSDTSNLAFSQTSQNKQDIEKIKKIHTVGEIDENTQIPIGRISETLFYRALKEYNIFIQPSSLRQDFNEHFDFFVLGFPVDVTCTYANKDYRKKFKYRDVHTLLIPIILSEWRRKFQSPYYSPLEFSYVYHLINNNSFDAKDYITEILHINNCALKIIQNPTEEIKNEYGLTLDQFGDVPKSFINKQETFLRCLQDQLPPLDNI